MNDFKPILDIRKEGPLIIAGPCSAESRDQVLSTARILAKSGEVDIFRAGVWKPRTRPGGFEGIGTPALEWLREAHEITGLPIATEVATPAHVELVLNAGINILWIGARTTANPFAMQELSDCLKGVADEVSILVKNPVSPDLALWIGAIQRLYNAGIRRLAAVHRGFSSYDSSPYRNRPIWQIPTSLRLEFPNLTLIADPSHIGGARNLIAPLSQRALDMGFDGLMIESHINPDRALSDSNQQLLPDDLLKLIKSLHPRKHCDSDMRLEMLRNEIDEIDREIIRALAQRMEVSRRIGSLKSENRMPVVQPERYNNVLSSRISEAVELGINPEMMRKILLAIHDESVRQQIEPLQDGTQDTTRTIASKGI